MRENRDDVLRDVEMMPTVYGPPPLEDESEWLDGKPVLVVQSCAVDLGRATVGSRFPVQTDEFSIGRGTYCDLRVENGRFFSREHARLFRMGRQWMLECMGVNGVTVDGVRCEKNTVKAFGVGSVLEFPGLVLRVEKRAQESGRNILTQPDDWEQTVLDIEYMPVMYGPPPVDYEWPPKPEKRKGLKGLFDRLLHPHKR